MQSFKEKIEFFKTIQEHLFKSTYLIHFDFAKQLYVDLNFSSIEINAMIYHVKSTFKNIFEYFRRNAVQSIMFLSKLMTSAETRYWSIELKIAELIWVLRKIRHLIEFIKTFIIIYIDHEATLNIAKQINLSTFSTDKLNLRFVRAFDYI